MYTKKLKFYFMVICILVLNILAACQVKQANNVSPASTVKPTNILTQDEWIERWLHNTPCDPPCWEGITAGVTTREEAFNLLAANSLFGSVRQDEDTVLKRYSILIKWEYLSSDTIVVASEGTVHFPNTSPDAKIQNLQIFLPPIPIERVFDSFGNPDFVITSSIENGDYYWSIWFIWVDKGFMFGTDGVSDANPSINAELTGYRICYFPPGLQNFIDSRVLVPITQEILIPWQGYGEFSKYSLDSPP